MIVRVSQIDPHNRNHNGVCLLRTETPDVPHSWRGWDGQGYTQSFVNPYTDKAANPDTNTCRPIGRDFFNLGSLAWSSIRDSFLLVARIPKGDKQNRPAGAYLWESKDLIHWSDATLLMSDAQAGQGVEQNYPSMIDPSAKDQNFTTIGNTATLYTMITTPGVRGYSSWKEVARTVRLKQ